MMHHPRLSYLPLVLACQLGVLVLSSSGTGGGRMARLVAAEEGQAPALGGESGGESAFWTVDFVPQHLRMISPRQGIGKGRVYWYLLYELKNPASEDRDIYVTITAVSDNKKNYADLYLPTVEKAIELKERQPLWGRTDEVKILAERDPKDPKYRYVTLKAGETRKCVAVFNAIDPNVSKIRFEITGLSNEIERTSKDDGSTGLKERVRELHYERRGDEYGITADSFKLVSKQWVKKTVALRETSDQSAAPEPSK